MSKFKEQILLVEDNPDHAEFISRTLNGDGVEIIIQSDGEKALNYLQGSNRLPSFVLLDVKLPAKDGFEVLGRLRAQDKFRDLPIVMLSTSLNPKDIRRAYRLGVNSFVTKPTDFNDFVKKVSLIKEFWLHSGHFSLPIPLCCSLISSVMFLNIAADFDFSLQFPKVRLI